LLGDDVFSSSVSPGDGKGEGKEFKQKFDRSEEQQTNKHHTHKKKRKQEGVKRGALRGKVVRGGMTDADARVRRAASRRQKDKSPC
jgi:hypothetical protein